MKYILLIGLSVMTTLAFAQTKKDSGDIYPTIGLHAVRKNRDKQLTIFADSLNNYKGGILPNFLFDVCLDWNGTYWKGFHDPISVRWTILQRVTNKRSLKYIIAKHDKELDELCHFVSAKGYPHLTVPMIEKTFYQLIKERYEQLK